MKPNLLRAYEKMLLIRIAEQELVNLYLREKIMSFVHFYVGQEAVAVGVCDALKKEDRVLGNHRSHGHYLAKGGNLTKMVSELLGRKTGLARGKGGSMHMRAPEVNVIGTTPILGSVVPLSCGSAFEQKFRREKGITTAFFGDGAFEEGVVYETLNLAALFKLPLLLVVENNLFAVNSKLKDRRSPNYDVEKIVTGLGAAYFKADGNDYEDVHAKAVKAVAQVRRGSPAVLECVAYRHMAHSAPIFDEGYREEDILEMRLRKDPLKKVRRALLARGVSEKKLVALEGATKKDVLKSVAAALHAPYPAKGELYTDLYAA